ncbi:hypothetical protein CI109_104591 [Kwoniella shandongensis]|uniref:Uncharacterized protein n=1 Tax=Kwoniella shandongensis TaxID=1734106 RepID=A0A5M6BT95_9TREE|nr:uncharacterized protein CI109_005519 [Kwoniella shandongensis]KAA5526086.1 hypothetical protein CI109_005519 [Kwoniella shandongensis]
MASASSAGGPLASSSGATSYTTPTKRAAFAPSAEAGPSRARPTGASPAYSSRRHSLYGIEDRIVIDPGSRVWKVGFSGETDPRAVFFSLDEDDPTSATEAWNLDLERLEGVRGSRSEGDRLVGVRVVKKLRDTFSKHLMTDPKSRKVIVVENTFLPTYVKEHLARTLFDNLKVPSVSFTSSSFLALAACGRITGLVVDIGWLETSVTPVYHSRPLYSLSRSTPAAGRRLHKRVRSLLLHYGAYIPPPTSLGNIHSNQRTKGVPLALLTDRLVERILTEGCLVGGVFIGSEGVAQMDVDMTAQDVKEGLDLEDETVIRDFKSRFEGSSSATDMIFKVSPTSKNEPRDMGCGTVIVPGWVRERAAEVLFEDDEEEEDKSIPRTILDCLLKLPIDLRPTLVSSMLITGGTPSLPGLVPRLRISLLQHLLPPPTDLSTLAPASPLDSPASRIAEMKQWRKRKDEPYRDMYGLARKLAILNDPAPLDGPEASTGGKAPRWVPSLMSWVGGSLAGSLKTSSPELLRETYDTLMATSISRGEAYRHELEASEVEIAATVGVSVDELRTGEALHDGRKLSRKRGWREGGPSVLGDWTRIVKA